MWTIFMSVRSPTSGARSAFRCPWSLWTDLGFTVNTKKSTGPTRRLVSWVEGLIPRTRAYILTWRQGGKFEAGAVGLKQKEPGNKASFTEATRQTHLGGQSSASNTIDDAPSLTVIDLLRRAHVEYHSARSDFSGNQMQGRSVNSTLLLFQLLCQVALAIISLYFFLFHTLCINTVFSFCNCISLSRWDA